MDDLELTDEVSAALALTRRGFLSGVSQAAVMSGSAGLLLSACAPQMNEPWDDGEFWNDRTGWQA